MRKQKEVLDFLVAFLQSTEPSPELLATFILGLVVANTVAQIVYDLLTGPALFLPYGGLS